MNAPTAPLKARGRFRWYQLYFALAAFDLLTIGFSLYLNHRLLGIHAASVAVDQVWADRLNRLSEVGRLVGKVGAPGDDVFASHKPAEEAANMKSAVVEFNAAMSAAEAELTESVSTSDAGNFRAMFADIHAGIGRVTANGALIFSSFQAGDRDKAGAHMAAMDRDLGTVDDDLVQLCGAIRGIQSRHFQEQLTLAHSLQRFEFVISLAVLLMIGAATVFGHKMASTMRAAERTQADHVAALQAAHDELEQRVAERTLELTSLNSSLRHEVEERKRAASALEEAQEQLLKSARHAGMAEVATGVLHNVGNVLNSANVSSVLVLEKLRASKAPKLSQAAALLTGRNGDLADFLHHDPQGQKLPGYLAKLGEHLVAENAELVCEAEQLGRNLEHIKEIVAMQQSYAKVSGVLEAQNAERLVEDAIAMNSGAFERHGVALTRQFSAAPPVLVDRHKVLQILINLLRNAKYALDDTGRIDKRLTISIAPASEERVRISVADNGIGIAPENLTNVFRHGFTTKKDGHGFGLHSGANAAKEMGGSLSVASPGSGLGATFALELPIAKTNPNP